MPRLSDSMEEGTILKWLVEQGGDVTKGEPLVEIESDKENATYDAEVDGTLVEILAKEGDTLAVGEPIARVDASSDSDNAGEGDARVADDVADDGDGGDAAFDPETPKVSPVAERIAEDEGVE